MPGAPKAEQRDQDRAEAVTEAPGAKWRCVHFLFSRSHGTQSCKDLGDGGKAGLRRRAVGRPSPRSSAPAPLGQSRRGHPKGGFRPEHSAGIQLRRHSPGRPARQSRPAAGVRSTGTNARETVTFLLGGRTPEPPLSAGSGPASQTGASRPGDRRPSPPREGHGKARRAARRRRPQQRQS